MVESMIVERCMCGVKIHRAVFGSSGGGMTDAGERLLTINGVIARREFFEAAA